MALTVLGDQEISDAAWGVRGITTVAFLACERALVG